MTARDGAEHLRDRQPVGVCDEMVRAIWRRKNNVDGLRACWCSDRGRGFPQRGCHGMGEDTEDVVQPYGRAGVDANQPGQVHLDRQYPRRNSDCGHVRSCKNIGVSQVRPRSALKDRWHWKRWQFDVGTLPRQDQVDPRTVVRVIAGVEPFRFLQRRQTDTKALPRQDRIGTDGGPEAADKGQIR